MANHVVGRAAHVGRAQALGGAVGLHVERLHGVDGVDRLLFVVPDAGRTPLPVGHQQRHGNVFVAVHGVPAVTDAGLRRAISGEAPVHQVLAAARRNAVGRTRAHRLQQAVEDRLGFGVVPGHDDRDQHAVAHAFGHRQVSRVVELDRLAAGKRRHVDNCRRLPGVVVALDGSIHLRRRYVVRFDAVDVGVQPRAEGEVGPCGDGSACDERAQQRNDGHELFDVHEYLSSKNERSSPSLWRGLWQADRDRLQGAFFSAHSPAIGKKSNAADRPSQIDHRPHGVMQRVLLPTALPCNAGTRMNKDGRQPAHA